MGTPYDASRQQIHPSFQTAEIPAQHDFIPSSSPAFTTPVHPIRFTNSHEAAKPSTLPILLPSATLRPLAFRTLTKKHNLTLTSSALQLLATFIGKHCGSGWREEGLAEKVLDEVAKSWKKSGGGVIVPGEGDDLKTILRNIEVSMSGGRIVSQGKLSRSSSLDLTGSERNAATSEVSPRGLGREDSQKSLRISSLDIGDNENSSNGQDPRQWLDIIGAFQQPRLTYNVNQRHFEAASTTSSLLANSSHKTQLFRHRYNIIHQRLLRNESFQTSSVAISRDSSLHRSSTATTIQQAYRLTPIANLLGRTGSNHLLLGLLTLSPTGTLTLNDLTGSISLDMLHARPIPEDGAWFTPGMIVLVDGVYEEDALRAGCSLEGNPGVGGSIGGIFIAFSMGGPPCERREVTLGVIGSNKDEVSKTAGGFGWIDFLGVGSERASGLEMRQLESNVLKGQGSEASPQGRGRMVIVGEVRLDDPMTLQALRKILGLYAADRAEQTPMVVVLIGNFVCYAVMTGGGSGGSIEYKEYFDALASVLSDYPSMLQNTTFVFVPGDNDPWASAFSAGAATVLPKNAVPELFTSRIKRAFATANVEAEKAVGRKTGGEAIWSTNPTRLTLFGPTQEIVVFRDNMSGRLRRNAVRFRPLENPLVDYGRTGRVHGSRGVDEAKEIHTVVPGAESDTPAHKSSEVASSTGPIDLSAMRKLVKTILDQGYLSPFPLSHRPVLWDHSGALHLYPLPTALVMMDPEAPPFAITYEGCHVLNPGSLTPAGRRGIAQWMEYDAKTRRGKAREVRY